MSISAPPGQPSISETISTSFRDAAAVTKTNLVPAAICAVLLTIAAISAATSMRGPGASVSAGFQVMLGLADIAFIVLTYFAIAAAVRTIHAEYGMTFGQFLGIFGYSLLAALLMAIAGLAFVIPAYWVGVKVLLMPYTYALTGGAADTLKTTWNMTTGYYWQTVGMLLLSALCYGVIAYAVIGICIFLGYEMPLTLIVLGPLASLVLTWLVHVRALVLVRWTAGLLPRANMPQGVPVTA